MKTKHTPGPWRLSENNAGIKGSNWIFAGEKSIAVVKLDTFARSLANARLIAAAPLLLAGCEYAFDLLSRNKPLSEEQRRRLLAALSGSIAEAKGKK